MGVYLAFVVDKCSDYWSSICTWNKSRDNIRSTFGRHAIPMVWDYAEANPFSSSSGNWMGMVDWTRKVVQSLPATRSGSAVSEEAQRQCSSKDKLVSTDPPYYDNIDYADLSDFFYVWLRRSLKSTFPDLFSTLAVPKLEELVAASRRHGSKEKAKEFFLKGMTQAIKRISEQAHPHFPVTIYYAFKQSESEDRFGIRRTGWETFLEAVIQSGFAISGTWPIRTERASKLLGFNANILASSIVLVCRRHSSEKPIATRNEFITALKSEIPTALCYLQEGNIAPVDLTQAAIGPGMAVYTSYSKVLDAEGNIVSVRDALALINQILDEVLVEREGDFDSDTRWALTWFEQHGFSEGSYGIAETLSKAKNTSIDGLVDAGILFSESGRVKLLKPDELSKDWDPATDLRLTVWEMVHHLICALEAGGELSASDLVARLGGTNVQSARELSYRLYAICERKKYLAEARSYNGLVQSWPEITRLALEKKTHKSVQTSLFDNR